MADILVVIVTWNGMEWISRCIDSVVGSDMRADIFVVDNGSTDGTVEWLLDKDRSLLYALAGDGKTIWEQRIGIVSTMQFVRCGQLDDTYAIADIFLNKPRPLHDLLQKAVGWLLRDAGKRDEDRLRHYLEINRMRMPRTTLRYAIEKFPPEERSDFLRGRE